jgi:adenosine kinase
MTKKFDIVGIGNAIVDILARTDDDFLAQENLIKGSMALIDEQRAHHIYNVMKSTKIVSGGSAANTIVGAALLGAKTGFIGRVKDDKLGHIFAHDLKSNGIDYSTQLALTGPSTARCYVLVTPDGERTMNTYLGASQNLSVEDVNVDLVADASVVYLEGYLWDPPEAKKAFLKAADIAHARDGRVALTLSDQFCVDRYRDEFLQLISSQKIDILFANEHELKSLFIAEEINDAIKELQKIIPLGIVTCSAQGSIIVTKDKLQHCPIYPIDNLVDTTGAGDLFAAGFLAGLTKDMQLLACAQLGAMAASEVIQHIGARPERDLMAMAQENGLLSL